MTCDRMRAAVLASDEPGAPSPLPPDVARHLDDCRSCARWYAEYRAGAACWAREEDQAGFAAAIVARTTGAVCDRVRAWLTMAPDGPLAEQEAAVVAAHLAECEPCRAFERELAAALAGLPTLATVDPGPGFADAVLARTSRRPPARSWLDRAREFGGRLACRPRIAWEVAYVVVLCWLLLFGPPAIPIDWTTARLGAVSADGLPPRVRAAGGAVQARVQSLQSRWMAGADTAIQAVAGRQSAAAQLVLDAQETLLGWWNRSMSALTAAFQSAWNALLRWAYDAFAAPTVDTEPPPPAARSSK